MPDKETLVASLIAAQKAMPTGISPDGKNPHFHSKYVTLAALTAAVIPNLNKHGLALTMSVENGAEPAKMVARLSHPEGQMEFHVPLGCPDMNNPQKVGSAITYARRQLLGMISGVAPDEDDDGNKAAEKPPASKRKLDLELERSIDVQSTELTTNLIARLAESITVSDVEAVAKEIAKTKPDLLADDVKALREAYGEALERVGNAQ